MSDTGHRHYSSSDANQYQRKKGCSRRTCQCSIHGGDEERGMEPSRRPLDSSSLRREYSPHAPLEFVTRLRSALVVAILLLAIATPQVTSAQELDCSVQIDRSQLSGSEFSFLDDLQQQIQEYLNARNWTEDEFQRQERISCSFQLIILESISLSEFRSRLVVTSRRPIYGTAQSTVVLRVNDSEWEFEYGRGTSLTYDLDRYNSLTSVLDFYAHVILGYDYDTFSPLGGTSFFEKARTVADQAEGAGDPGWSSMGTEKNRAQLISNLVDQRHRELRRAAYRYHLEGLDRFVGETQTARETVLDVLETLRTLNRQLSRSYALDLFFSTKYEELAALFAGSDMASQAHNILTQIDPSHSTEYNKIVE